jgi:putative RNA 2'-phosphotransferase
MALKPNTRKALTEASKFLSYVLRHRPDSIGLTLDSEGWVDISELIAAAVQTGTQLDRQLIDTIVDTSDKKRFAISEHGLRIRALQGHSTEAVAITYAEKVPPAVLYHGTAARFLESIRRDGLLAGSRHYVHLSGDPRTAQCVGERYGKPAVLTVQARSMHQQGFRFYQAENGVWLTEAVPVQFMAE